MRSVWLLCALLVPLSVVGQEQLVGKPGPDFRAGDMLYDADVRGKSLAETKGEVVLIKYWGLNCPPCKAAMPALQRIWTELGGKGLHVFHIESQGHTAAEVETYCEKMGYTFPQTMRSGASDFGGYQGGNGLPYAFLIGVDGTVIWQGSSGYEAKIAEEVAKVRYPGLGRSEVAAGLEKAAHFFATGKYANAISEAEKKRERAEGNDAVLADATYIIDRVRLAGERLKAAAERACTNREYGLALATYTELSRGFKGQPIADEVTAKVAEMRKDPAIKKELNAEGALEGLLEKVKKAPTREQQIQLLEAFAKSFDGTKAAEKALRRKSLL
ncbi:MAG: TlpA family protein disulfide reductase [Planctomycetota bacterium]